MAPPPSATEKHGLFQLYPTSTTKNKELSIEYAIYFKLYEYLVWFFLKNLTRTLTMN
jgi:hypothetical protein